MIGFPPFLCVWICILVVLVGFVLLVEATKERGEKPSNNESAFSSREKETDIRRLLMNGTRHHQHEVLHRTSTNGYSNSIPATEGWLELFLTPAEKLQFSSYQEVVHSKPTLLYPIVRFFECFHFPDNVSPNLLILSGLVILVQAWYIIMYYGENYPQLCTVFAASNTILFFILNSVSLYHADRIRQHTALSDLFKYSCDLGSTIFLAILVCYCWNATLETTWYVVYSSQIILFLKHLSAFRRQSGLRYRYQTGPAEVLVICTWCLLIRSCLGDWDIFEAVPYVVESIKIFYYVIFGVALVQSMRIQNNYTRCGLLISLGLRLFPALLLGERPVTWTDIVCDGLFMSVLTTDISLAKMAGRQLHPWVICMSLLAVVSNFVILTLVAVYYIGVFSDLCASLNLPLLAVVKNVYCDGVYDLCHIGHKRAFQRALKYGNRLFVGVVGDKDAQAYKRPPIMNHDERCAEVEACKAVTKVIRNAPCFGLTQDFLDLHNIHVVAMGEEYLDRYPDPNDDPYYGYVRKIGIAVALPRTKTLSTSELIERIQNSKIPKKKSPT